MIIVSLGLTAFTAHIGNPFDADTISNLQIIHVGPKLYHLADAFVSADLVFGCWFGERGPLDELIIICFCIMNGYRRTELHITPRSEWQTPEYRLALG